MADFTHKRVDDVKDSAPEFGFGEHQEARFATDAVDAEQTGFSFHRIKPGMRQGFAHTHEETEEVYYVARGSGRMKLDEEIIDLAPQEFIRVGPGVIRAFEGGDDGLEVVAFGRHNPDDRGETFPDWWKD
ncbi:hypothetical protein BH20ACT15_BH20ACT15_08390 [soil metagenome]